MSRVETHIGRLRRLDFLSENEEQFADLSVEEWIKAKCEKEGISKKSYFDSWLEAWNDKHFKEPGYIIKSKGEYYEIIEDKDIEEEDVQEIYPQGKDTYDYVMKFYNGGTCLSEMLEESLDELKNK